MSKSSVFSLEQFYRKQINGTASTINDVFVFKDISNPLGTDYGYFGGGSAPGVGGPYSSVDRLDFASDSTNMVTKGPLSRSAAAGGATGNTSYGYAAGGGWPIESTVDRVDYSSDTGTAATKGPLETNTGGMGSVTNNTYGYFASGRAPSEGVGWTTEIQRIEYASDTSTSVVKGTVAWPAGGQGVAGTGNMDYGYFGGGRIYPGPGYLSVSFVGRIDYTNDTQTAPSKGPLTQIRGFLAAAGNADYGYFGGGQDQNGSSYMSIVDRVDYSNDTATASPKGNLADGKHYISATGNTSYGYWAGGYGNTTKCQRVDFSNDTATASLKGNLSQFNTNQYAFSSRICNLPTTSGSSTFSQPGQVPVGNPYGYFGGGNYGGTEYSSVDRIDFDTNLETALVRGPLLAPRKSTAGASSPSYGYWAGGFLGGSYDPSQDVSNVDRLDYSSDTSTTVAKGNLSAAGGYRAGASTINYGYFSGGTDLDSRIQRLDYSSDTSTTSNKATMPKRTGMAGVGNQSYGYFMGGNSSTLPSFTTQSRTYRIDYSNDTSATVQKGNMGQYGYYGAATGNAEYGYASWGYTGDSRATRMEYANDTSTMTNKLAFTNAYGSFSNPSATGNTSIAIWALGNTFPVTNGILQKMDFSNDTAASLYTHLTTQKTNILEGGVSSRENAAPTTAPGTTSITTTAFGAPQFGPAFGYRSGGGNTGYGTKNDRIDYSNDTATAPNRVNSNQVTGQAAATSNKDFGFVAGGQSAASPTPGGYCTIERLDYSSDTSIPSPRGTLEKKAGDAQATGNSDFGYWGGGKDPDNSPQYDSILQRLDYSNDLGTTYVRGNIGLQKWGGDSTSNGVFAYFTGGLRYNTNDRNSQTSRIDFANDTQKGTKVGNLPEDTAYLGATGNQEFGYFAGGTTDGSTGGVSTVNRLDYATDMIVLSPKGNLSGSRYYLKATGSKDFGYFMGGTFDPSPNLSTIDRIDYSSDTTTASPKGNLSEASILHTGHSSRSNKRSFTLTERIKFTDSNVPSTSTVGTGFAYFGGGFPAVVTVDRVEFASDTSAATPKGAMTSGRYKAAGVGNTKFGYFGGGVTATPAYVTTVDRLDYSSDSTAMVAKGSLSTPKRGQSLATGNDEFGYFGGGQSPSGNSSGVDRIDYSNDTVVASPKGTLTLVRSGTSATGNSNFGYFGGGETPSRVSSIDRIEYSNDTVVASPKGLLNQTKDNMGATANNDFGYWGGGTTGSDISSMDRADFSNDTVTTAVKGSLSAARWQMSAAGNPEFGYWGGGYPGPSGQSTVDRLDYSNDTATASPKGNLSVPHRFPGGFSSRDYGFSQKFSSAYPLPFPVPQQKFGFEFFGYFGGGYNPSSVQSGINRIDFNNDTVLAAKVSQFQGSSPSVNNNRQMQNCFGIANKNSAYWGGGTNQNGSEHSTIFRLSLANESVYAVNTGILSYNGQELSAVGTNNFGYINGDSKSKVDRLDYSNDGATTSPKGNLNQTRVYPGATGNKNFGYFGGGGPSNSTVDRIDYASDTSTASARGNLGIYRTYLAATGNQNYGYFAGGGGSLGNTSRVERIDYANDTASTSNKDNLTLARNALAATGNQFFGYFAGGTPGPKSTVDRLDYSNDTFGMSNRGSLDIAKDSFAGASAGANALNV